ncbi:two-pore potassium channel 1-like isoform X2 [Nicotiana sylvestris]|uniref:Two-pore potassium channel 1-like isoform X2 n=2 Tax=Nicotiana TaxID=4085 RepID=A0A1S3YKH2_TOBAC|nr:PREDICTED: two-pore potassium channel 1-like isoform X2 [Nicotiana sylvestris]XP_016452447.1 PREDICTED: two-pore potassium channel 1-like isoform X2 [Nicotiana tabacum]
MDKGDVEQPLLRSHVNSLIRFSDINSFKRRRTQSSSSTGIGAICFFIIRDQIEGKKTNGILDAIYLCIVTMTTVGYGDLVPKSILAKLLACIFVFTGMALVGFVLSKAADSFLERQQILFLKAINMRKNYSNSNEVLQEVETNIEKYKFLSALALLVMFTILGTIFLNQVEDLSLFDAFYCVCATITTLGYGDKSFSTKWGRLFASFWILLSTICLGQLFYSLAELYTEQRRKSMFRWVLTRELTNSDLQAADLDHDSEVSAAEFIVYKLKELGKITEEDISVVMESFKMLDVDHSGTLTEKDIALLHSSRSKI